MMEKKRVLFLCTGNSARSQMAEGLVNHLLGDQWEAHSAGTQPADQVHPLAVQVMNELGINISAQQPKPADRFRGTDFDLVVTLCGDAAENCPLWLGRGRVAHIGFPDPAQATGDETERLAVFREVRDQIREQVIAYLLAPQEGRPGQFDLHLGL
ncbi:MAG: arsenate reductase ArsC [Anaerolineae bacterium]|mgnify:CR=1 FL=1